MFSTARSYRRLDEQPKIQRPRWRSRTVNGPEDEDYDLVLHFDRIQQVDHLFDVLCRAR